MEPLFVGGCAVLWLYVIESWLTIFIFIGAVVCFVMFCVIVLYWDRLVVSSSSVNDSNSICIEQDLWEILTDCLPSSASAAHLNSSIPCVVAGSVVSKSGAIIVKEKKGRRSPHNSSHNEDRSISKNDSDDEGKSDDDNNVPQISKSGSSASCSSSSIDSASDLDDVSFSSMSSESFDSLDA